LPTFEKWYGYKKPVLQIRILERIALEGELSKRKLQEQLDAHYPDISDAVESLKKGEIIKQSRADFARGRRAEIYYKLTKRGLEVIVDEFSDPEIFWKAMISYCELSKHPISPEEFAKYYKPFEAKYLGYRQAHDFFFQYDSVDKLFEEWLSAKNDNIVPITISQKVLECIGVHRSVTLEQILEHLQVQKTKCNDVLLKEENAHILDGSPLDLLPDSHPERKRYLENKVCKENIINVINRYTIPSNYSFHQFLEISESEEISTKYSEFISQLLIRVIESSTGKRYELTLFGVILILAIVYQKRTVKSYIYFNELLLGHSIEKYYNIVVSNYKDRLPLIFKKWQLLVKVFINVDHLAQYFEPVFDQGSRKYLISLPVSMGGVKELYENMHSLSFHRYSKLIQIYENGCAALNMTRKDMITRTSFVKKTLSHIELRLGSADLKRFMEYAAKQNENYSIYQTDQTDIITTIENSFGNEISFLFYIGLASKVNLVFVGDEHIMPSELYEFISFDSQQENIVRPRNYLLMILGRDTELKNKIMTWIKDSSTYEKQIIDNMDNLRSEIDLC
jgi:hypothetical protein